jgi:cytochrome c oxidase assembly protein subunit 15
MATAALPVSQPSESRAHAPKRSHRAVAIWIFTLAAMVLTMVVVGGVTRLTRSGLSITEWKPVTGALPPMGEAAWLAEFAKYQASPEYRQVNAGMTLAGFQSIFLVEWFHRLLGRLVGVVTFVPLVVFAARRMLAKRRGIQLGGLFLLGGLQGALGWFMVKSGLVDLPRVSPYRLTAHLLMALAIFAGLLWVGLDEVFEGPRGEAKEATERPARVGHVAGLRWATALVAMSVITIAWGGFMAGLHAGHVAPTFPTMNGAWIPDGVLGAQGLAAPFENALLVHFLHRLLAYATAIVATAAAVAVLRSAAGRGASLARGAAIAVIVVLALQITLGALTVLQHVPVWLAALHQGNGALLLGAAVVLLYATSRLRAQAASPSV